MTASAAACPLHSILYYRRIHNDIARRRHCRQQHEQQVEGGLIGMTRYSTAGPGGMVGIMAE